MSDQPYETVTETQTKDEAPPQPVPREHARTMARWTTPSVPPGGPAIMSLINLGPALDA